MERTRFLAASSSVGMTISVYIRVRNLPMRSREQRPSMALVPALAFRVHRLLPHRRMKISQVALRINQPRNAISVNGTPQPLIHVGDRRNTVRICQPTLFK